MALKKPVVTLFCEADFRTDRCPAKIAGNDYPTVQAACMGCEYMAIKLHGRGKTVAEIRENEANLPRRDKDLAEIDAMEV
jgi:hypothetical protein